MINIRFDREKLFNQIWSKHFGAVANQHKISWKQLESVCEILKIPRPDQRQRIGIAYKRKVDRPELPKHDLQYHELELDRLKPEEILDHLPSGYEPFQVSQYLRNPHSIILRTKENIEAKKKRKWNSTDKYNRLSPSGSGYADILATKELLPRAYRIYDCILKEMDRHGYIINTKEYNKVSKLYIKIEGIDIYLRVQENGKQNRKKTTNKRWDDYEYNYKPSGKLKLLISDSLHWVRLRTISDTKNKTIEEQLEKFYVIVFALVGREKEEKEERRIEHLKWKEIQDKNKKIRIENELELRKRETLEIAAESFIKSQYIYQFIEGMKAYKEKQGLNSEENVIFDEWQSWAICHADRLNTVKEQFDSIFSKYHTNK